MPQPGMRTWLEALRARHWIKNLLVFVPSILGSAGLYELSEAVVMFVLLGIVASSTYVINDLFDLASDRSHPHKRLRPFAAGVLPLWQGAVLAAAAICFAFAASLLLDLKMTLVLGAYLIVTLAYSFRLKNVPFVDVTVLACLFTLRIFAGGLLVPVSPWLLTFSMFFFFGLAIVIPFTGTSSDQHAHAPCGSAATSRCFTPSMIWASGTEYTESAVSTNFRALFPRAHLGRPHAICCRS